MLPNLDLERRVQILERFMREIRGDRGATEPTAWTPQLYQNGNLTSTINYANYMRVGRLAVINVDLSCTQAGTAGNQIEIRAFPAAIAFPNSGSIEMIGIGIVLDQGTAFYPCAVVALTSTSVRFYGYATGSAIGSAPSFALASGDLISFALAYQL